jgi:hypothetical protein
MPENIQEEIEDKIIDWIAMGTGGRLIAFKPDNAADLAVQRKGDYPPGKELFLVLDTFIKPSDIDIFKTNIPQSRLAAPKNFYLLFVIFDEIKQKIEQKFWFLPASNFIKIAEKIKLKDGSEALRFDASLFSEYLTDKNNFNNFLIEKLISENKPRPKGGFKRKHY